ncbi:unnamed protein product [Echinostoma caproni]|uniref:Decapping nuclease n=1 Tax=Echinostoma caproni TaxID=27848 RepID=A0A183ACF9_9TREM|nr:unnamed protein product [Echinostoma caproni]
MKQNRLRLFTHFSKEYQTVFVEGAIYVDGKKVEYKADHDKWDGNELGRLKEKACALVSWFYSTYAKYHGQVIPLEVVYNSKSNDQIVTSLFSSSKELLKAGMIIRREYAKLLAQPKQQSESTFAYTITDFKRRESLQFDGPFVPRTFRCM